MRMLVGGGVLWLAASKQVGCLEGIKHLLLGKILDKFVREFLQNDPHFPEKAYRSQKCGFNI